jgi:CheY-like chemotaxis protein
MSKKLLVVDDDLTQRDFYVEFFRQKGYEVTPANDGLEGLDIALQLKPDLVFTGIIMPRMDGFEFIHNLRNNAITAQTPVIMFSHLGREEDREKAKKLANVIFMVKGMDGPKVILEHVEKLTNKADTKRP